MSKKTTIKRTKNKGANNKRLMKTLKQLIALDDAADRAAVANEWNLLSDLNQQIDKVYEKMMGWGYQNPEELLKEARKLGIKPDKPLDTSKKVSGKTLGGKYLDTGFSSTSGKSSKTTYVKCAHTHPLLTIGEEKLKIQGGSCYSPQGVYDVEILLCGAASLPTKILPWEKTQFVRYPITDMSVPKNKEEFEQVVDWTIEQMRAGRSVHVGCIGGHGRTGTFLAVLVHKITGDTDTIRWLRKHYCDKAVESSEQIDWLHEHWGIKKVKASKSWTSYNSTSWDDGKVSKLSFGSKGNKDKFWEGDVAIPLPDRSVWGDTKII